MTTKHLKKEQDNYKPIPAIRKLDNVMVQQNYLQIKRDVKDIVDDIEDRLMNDPALKYLIIQKN